MGETFKELFVSGYVDTYAYSDFADKQLSFLEGNQNCCKYTVHVQIAQIDRFGDTPTHSHTNDISHLLLSVGYNKVHDQIKNRREMHDKPVGDIIQTDKEYLHNRLGDPKQCQNLTVSDEKLKMTDSNMLHRRMATNTRL